MRRIVCAFALALLSAQISQAGLITFTDPNVSGFVANSASNTPAFLGAIGTPTEFISFSTDKFGNPAPSGPILGSAFSNRVTLSSAVSSIGFGGTNSAFVRATGSGIGSEVGPDSGFNGTLIIDFLANGNTASIVGFGPVELGGAERIRVYDQNNVLAGTFPGLSNLFSFFGVQGTAGTQIGRVELDGQFYAIQDLQFNLAVPEPVSLAVFGGLLAVGGLAARRRMTKVTA